MAYWPVSNPTAWQAALAASVRRPKVYCDLYSGVNGPKLNAAPLTIVGGSVSFDSTQAVRRQASGITFTVDTTLAVPSSTTDLAFPDGTEIVPYSGFTYPDGTFDVVPQGRLLMEKVITSDDGSNLLVVTDGIDRMESLARNEFTQASITVPTTVTTQAITTTGQTSVTVAALPTGSAPYLATITDGINTEVVTVTAIDPGLVKLYMTRSSSPHVFTYGVTVSVTADVTIGGLVQDRLPGVPMNLTPSTSVLAPVAFNIGDDPAKLILDQALAASTIEADGDTVGMEAYFDQVGTFTLAAVADSAGLTVSASYAEGPGCTMTALSRTLSNKGIPNWIIVVSQGSNVGAPIRSDWQDLEPSSPTYLYGPYPTTVQHVTTALATTQAQVDAMALALGTARLGTFDALTMNYLGDPAHDAGDVVAITRQASRLAGAPYVMQKGTLDLGVGGSSSMTGYSLVGP